MEAYVLKQNGGIENLYKTVLPTPEVGRDEVLIKTKAIGVNPIDVQVRNHKAMLDIITQGNVPEPVILGWDVAGVIEKVGPGVDRFKVGDDVFGLINMPGLGSTNATYVKALANHIALKPVRLSFTEAAATPMAALTAWQAVMTLGRLKNGTRVLIHGASGGVGHFAVQIARQVGAYVIGTASGKNESFVRGLGVHECIDYTTHRFEEHVKNVDVVIDTVNAVDHVLRSIKVIKKGGRLVFLQPHFQNALAESLEAAQVTGHGVFVHSSGENLEQIGKLIEQGHIQPHVSQVFAFDQLPDAHAAMASGATVGKIVVSVP